MNDECCISKNKMILILEQSTKQTWMIRKRTQISAHQTNHIYCVKTWFKMAHIPVSVLTTWIILWWENRHKEQIETHKKRKPKTKQMGNIQYKFWEQAWKRESYIPQIISEERYSKSGSSLIKETRQWY